MLGTHTLNREFLYGDLDNVRNTGSYLISASSSNNPAQGWGILDVSGDGVNVSQRFMNIRDGFTWSRGRMSDEETFSPWQRIDNFGYNSLAELIEGAYWLYGNT